MFTLYVDQLDPAEFDQHHKGKWFFKNGHYCFADRRFHSVTDRLDHNTDQMVSKTAFSECCEDTASKIERLVDYFEQIFPVADDFDVFKNMIGCAVRGEHQKRLLVIYGIGHNGKSSFLPLLMKALGGYSVVTSNDLLTEDISTSKPRSDLQRLCKRRLAIIQEPSSQKHFNSSAIKAITGGDTIECRGYHQNQIQQFRNTALIVVSCNDLPNMDKMDVATANRFVCIEARSRFIVQHEYDAAVNKTNLFVANPYYQSDAFYDDYTEATQHLLIQWAAQYEGVELKLTEDISTSKPRSDLQRLQNRRLAIIQEPSTQKQFNSSSLKAITGGDTIECRGYHQNEILQFRNTALIVVSCNDLPNMDKMDVATANRFVCIEARSRFIVQHEYDAAVDKTNLFVANPYYQSDAFYDDYTEAAQRLLMQWAAQYEGVELKLTEDIKGSVDSYLNSNGVLDWFEEHYEQATETEFVRLGDVWDHFNGDNHFEMKKNDFFTFVKKHPTLSKNFKGKKKVNGKQIRNVLARWKLRALACESDDD